MEPNVYYNPPYITDEELESGGSIDWEAVEADRVSITATNDIAELVSSVEGGAVRIRATGADGVVYIQATGEDGAVQIQGDSAVRIYLKSPNGSAFLLSVADDGTLSAEAD